MREPADMTIETAREPLLELRDITKRFPGVLANDRIDLSLAPGEVLGLLGENGAGKSTLMHIVSGVMTPDEGEIRVAGEGCRFDSAGDAIDRGIGMVHQHFMLVPTLSVVENVILGDETVAALRPRISALGRKIKRMADEIGLPVDPFAEVGSLDVGSRQRVEIIKALYRGARILILDEPTTVLTEGERERLFEVVRGLARQGVGIVLISHKLDDIFAVCDRVLVLRQGRVAAEATVSDTSRERLVEAMVGARVEMPSRSSREAPGPRLLAVEDLAVRRDNGSLAFGGVSFALHRGEILALAGVDGNGQRELAEAVTGLREPERGRVEYEGAAVGRGYRPRALRRAGIRHVPADRHAMAVVTGFNLPENFLLTHFFRSPYVRGGWLHWHKARSAVESIVDEYSVKAARPSAPITALSGGNQQKLVLGREFDADARLIVAVHPTRGLDVRTVAFIQEKILEKRREGIGILLISADLNEIWQVADRVMVLSQGKLFGPRRIEETDLQEVGAWMAAS